MSRKLSLIAASWFLVGGCVVIEDNLAHVDQELLTSNGVSPNGVSPNGVSPNGVSPNGVSPNGVSPNGVSPNGVSPNGVSPNGVSPNGVSPNGVSPNGVTLNGVSPNGISPNGTQISISMIGAPLSGHGLVGSTWTGHVSDGTTVALRIDEAQAGTGANTDLWIYRISVSADGLWRPLCLDHDGAPSFADTIPGTWNLAEGVPGGGAYHPTTADFTIACRGSAIAKCLEFGYRPWADRVAEIASCVRALRGDYCGDGTPYTVNGTLVNIFDGDGVQTDDAAWVPEAEWGPDGALCVSKKRATRFDQVAHEKPSCYPHALKPEKSCGTGFTGGAVIITERPPQ
jgi:ADYC domain